MIEQAHPHEAGQSEKPFIIWTLQRTGGTNLTKSLVAMSRYRIEHEPFNRPRIYGQITKDWIREGDIAATRQAVQGVCTGSHNIKHCVETIPWEISEALILSPTASDYNHFFLVREDSVRRLLSMEYAKRTKVWGPSHDVPDLNADPAFDAPLDTQALARHEARSIERLNRAWDLLSEKGIACHAISYEQIYQSTEDEAATRLATLVRHLGLDVPDEKIQALCKTLRGRGDQGTSDRYDRFSGIDLLKNALDEAPRFSFLP